MQPPATSVYDRIGGATVVEALVDEFYERVLDDPSLSPCFVGVDLARLRAHQRTFVAAAIGGPDKYTGRALSEAHAQLEVSDAMFDRANHHLGETLVGLGLDADSVTQIMEKISALRNDVVSGSQQDRNRTIAPR